MTHRDEDEEIIDGALDTLAWQRREIDRLKGEVGRLEALFTNATYEARAMMEEIERLRAELSGWREMAGKAEQ